MAAEWLANSRQFARARRAALGRLPFMQLRRDVVDVVYLTWLLPIDAVRHWTLPGLQLWCRKGLTPFTVLTYRHRHFGPALLGRLRGVCASPLQSNWRLYVEGAIPGAAPARTVLFTHNVLGNGIYAVGARAMSDALPADLAARFEHGREGDTIRTCIEPGVGSAPALQSLVKTGAPADLPVAFQRYWADWACAVEALTLQDAAVTAVQHDDRIAHARIDLPVDLARVQAAVVQSLSCPEVAALGALDDVLCFVVPEVPFRVLSEQLLPPLRDA